MNKQLMEAIVKHIFARFAIIPSAFINFDKTKSLMDKGFLLSENISFSDENGNAQKNKVWGCQISAEQQEIKILLGDCSEDKSIREYALLVHLKNAPTYGVYLVSSDEIDSEPLIAVSMDGKSWIECSTYLQATFLAGMEQIKDVGLGYSKCSDYKDEFEKLMAFINFHHTLYEDQYEGQES